MQRIATALAVAILLVAPVALAAGNGTDQTGASGPVRTGPARTGKERLSDKASDEQRSNDCKVPPIRRTRPRPSDCQTR